MRVIEIANGILRVGDKIITDTEWINAWNADEKTLYYKCEMLNHGWIYKCYKPSVARLVLKRHMYMQMIPVGVKFILEDKMPDGIKSNGWYGGRNKKYSDMFDLTSEKKYAKVFENQNEAQKIANSLNKNGWNFVVLPV